MKYLPFRNTVVFLLFGIAAFLRTYQIEEYPLTVNQDELNNIYDGWSFAVTGKDRWETPNPFVLKGLGNNDYRQSTEALLCALVFKFTGFSIPAARYLSSVLGMLSLLLLFLFCRKLMNEEFAMIALMFAVFSPYHVQMSRMAHEGSILPSIFFIGILYTWLFAREKGYPLKYSIFLGLLIGLSVNTYRSMYVIGPLLLLPVCIDMFRQKQKALPYVVFVMSAIIGALPQIYSVLTLPEQVMERANNVVLKPEGFGYPFMILRNIYDNLAPVFLFFDYGKYNNLTVLRELPFEVLPFYVGVLFLLFRRNVFSGINSLYLFAMLIISVMPAAISLHNPHALRSSTLSILIPVVSACGFWYLKSLYRPASKAWIVLLLCLNIGFFQYYARDYMVNDILRNHSHQHEMVKLGKWLSKRHKVYDSVFIDHRYNCPYLYIISYVPVTPEEFHAADKNYTSDAWIRFTRVNKFRFMKMQHLRNRFEKDSSHSHLYISFEKLGTHFDTIGNIYDKTYFTRAGDK